MNFAFLDKIREQEVAVAGPKFREPPGRLLEIGAGTGAQAVVLAARGFQVSAIEIAGSIYENEQVFPVAIYDGAAIPFPDASFDIVFSSHVLVHIVKHDDFQKEILRVLKPGGRVVHILPTTSWRFWTCLVHYPISYIRHGARILNRLTGNSTQPSVKTAPVNASGASLSFGSRLLKLLALPFTPPARIGEHGNALSEHYLFSERCWKDLFQRNGQTVEACLPNHLFYTGHLTLGPRLHMQARTVLSYLLGSAGKVYVMRLSK